MSPKTHFKVSFDNCSQNPEVYISCNPTPHKHFNVVTKANFGLTKGLSPVEQAADDAQKLPRHVFDGFKRGDEKSLKTALRRDGGAYSWLSS